MDTILNRHARKLLSSNRLKDLGRFSAYLNFDLREWLRKERYGTTAKFCFYLGSVYLLILTVNKRHCAPYLILFYRNRAAIINDFIEAFLSIHRQFDWPFPAQSTINTVNSGTFALSTLAKCLLKISFCHVNSSISTTCQK